ncbi:MAG: UbiD family decarboxylase [Proteobacteria bacterium]|nr:UbiD family decarboxylase [Pseudomonadota bacterium]
MAKELRGFLKSLKKSLPHEIVGIDKIVNPAEFEVTALLRHLEVLGKFPVLLVEKPLNLMEGEAGFRLITNVFATRQNCALAMGLDPSEWKLELSIEYSRREKNPIHPRVVNKENAPVKEIVHIGERADLRILPIVRHHEKDGGPYVDMTPVMKDPENGFYNVAFLRN